MQSRKVVLLELNEITWDLIDPLITEGKLPTFARLKREGAVASPMSVDEPPFLDPWITWTSVYSGTPQDQHKVAFLQQPPETIKSKRIWELLSEAGRKVGIYGSVCSWPAKPLDGYHVPDTFSQDYSTYPESLEPIQRLNLTYTRSIRLPNDQDGMMFKAKLGSKLLGLGLRLGTGLKIASQLVSERLNPKIRWKRVCLQPLVNFDFFSKLYRKHRPDFATFHSNHVAHFQHTYWKMMQPDEFRPLETTQEDIDTYGKAIEYGYQSADALIASMLDLIDDDTVLVIASSMGQQPFRSSLKTGKRIGQLRSHDQLMEALGYSDKARAVAMMSDQFNVYAEDDVLTEVRAALEAVYIDTPDQPAFTTEAGPGAVTVTLKPWDSTGPDSVIHFAGTPGEPTIVLDELIYFSGLVKSGCHHPKGMMLMYGAGVKAGAEIADCNNLDIAPTLMALLGEPVPSVMTGRTLDEAFVEPLSAVREQETAVA